MLFINKGVKLLVKAHRMLLISLVWEPVASLSRDNKSIAVKRFAKTMNDRTRTD